MQSAEAALMKLASTIHPLDDEVLSAFASAFTSYSAKRKHTLTATGSKEKYLYFVTEGVQRIFYLDEYENEATILFTYPFSFGGVLDSFMLQQPSKYHFETLSASSFLRIGFLELEKLRTQYPSLEIMLNKGLSHALSGVLERLAEVQCLTAEEKLRRLFSRSPHVFQLIPQKYLANYLGIDATNFSKLINSVKL